MGKSSNPTFAGDKEFEKIHLKEKFSYGLGDVACNVVYALTTSLLIYFYTNVVGISAAMIGTIMLFSRFFDGISDVLIGHLVDRTHSKHGKSRAWILWMMIPYGIAAILLFTVPPATPIVKGIYVFITYNFCTTVVYTALNLPYATLATLMTRDTDQRAVVNLFRTGMSALGNMVITAVTFPLVTRLGDTQQAWIEVSILYAIVSIIMLFICFKNCHERVKEETKTKDGKNVPLWMGIKLCVTNKYFIMFFMLAVFLSFYEAVTGTCNAYYAQYILGNRDLLGALDGYDYIGVGRDNGKTKGEYAAIFYKKDRVKLLNKGNFWLNETPDKPKLGWDAACIRICSWGEFEQAETGFRFYYFNLHMDHVGVVARREAAKLVVKKIGEIAKGAPVVLTGDFNVDQNDEIYRIFTSSGILNDSYTHARLRFAENGTFNDYKPYMKTQSRIDHVFVSPEFNVDRYGMLTNMYWTDDAPTEAKNSNQAPSELEFRKMTLRTPSDHYPVFVRINYKK